jgi:hypothetical protein
VCISSKQIAWSSCKDAITTNRAWSWIRHFSHDIPLSDNQRSQRQSRAGRQIQHRTALAVYFEGFLAFYTCLTTIVVIYSQQEAP